MSHPSEFREVIPSNMWNRTEKQFGIRFGIGIDKELGLKTKHFQV